MPGDFDNDPTRPNGGRALAEPETARHNTVDFNAGREAGYTEGVELVLVALRLELSDWSPAEMAPLFSRLRAACRDAG